MFCLLSISYASAQQLNISGVVISSEDNEPLIGATVSVKGNPTKGVITDINGQFQLSVETGTKLLVVSYVGMKTQEIRVPRKEKELKIVLIPETMDIDEVVVTGYGNFSKSSFTGSANTLRTDMLKEVPVMSVEQKLQGMTTGVQITSSSGQPGANQSIRIRGMGSFNASQEPLFVIDGVPVTSGSMSSGGPDAAYMNNSKTNIMSTLNPSDIENVTVIKDAAAASRYGSRAANGVILITTKKGNTGKVRVDLNVSGGFSHAAVDLATLTGAIVVALGNEMAGLFSNDDVLSELLSISGEQSGEELWRFPLTDAYRKLIKSDMADVKNISDGRAAGSITAACFLEEFLPGKTPWAHLDIAGMDMFGKPRPLYPKGASGFGVRLINRFLRNLEQK